MIGKNNSKLFMEKGANKYKRYTLKKLSVGVVSVSIGFGLMFGSVEGVSADELTGTNSVVEPNNIDSLQSNEEVSDESNINISSEPVENGSLEQDVPTDQSLEIKRKEVKTILGQSNIVGEQYTDLVTKIANAQTLDELEGILAEIKHTASLEDNQDESKQSETEDDAEEKLKNYSEEKDGELDKITPPSTETSLSKESSVENLVRTDQLNVTSDVKYTLNDVRHLLNAADIARIESGELTVQQIIEKLLNNKVELRETEAHHENGVLAAGVEKSSLSTDKQRGKSRSRRSLNNINVDSLFQPFTEENTVRDVYDRIKQMRDAKLIAETELHFLQIEVLRHLRNDIANNEQDSNNLTPKNAESKLPTDEQILNMHLSNQADVTIPMNRLVTQPIRKIVNDTKKELSYINEILDNIRTVLLTKFGTNEEGVYFSQDEYHSDFATLGSHKTNKEFHEPIITSNSNGTFTLKMSNETEGGVGLSSHYAFSFNLNSELHERVKDSQTVRGLYRPEKGQPYDENGDKLQNQVSNPLFEVNEYSPQSGSYPGYVGYYISQWSEEGGYDRKKDYFAKTEFTFEANDQMITEAKISTGILSNSYNYRHRPGTFIASKEFNEKAEELKTLLNLMTESKQLKNKIAGTKQKIDEFNQSLGDSTRVLSQRDYDNLNIKHKNLKQEIEKINTDYTTLTNKAMYGKLHQQVKADVDASKSVIETRLKDLYSVNDLNNNGKKDTEDITFAEQKVKDAKDKQIALLSEINMLTSKLEITQEEYTQLINMHEEFKKSIKDGRNAINAIPQSDEMSLLGETYNAKRDKLERDLPQDNVKLPAAPTTATQTSSDPNEKNSITNPTLINGDFSDLSQGAKVGAESVNNGVNSVPGWTVVNRTQEVIPLINRRKTPTATVSKNEFVNPNNNNAVVLGVSSTEFFTDNLNKGKIDVDKVGGIFQTINVTPGSELVVKFRADSPGYHAGNDQGFDNKRHAVAQAQVEISDPDTGTVLKTILPPSRGHGESVGIVNIPEGVNRVKVTLSHKSARTHNISKGDLASKGWYPGAVVSDVRVSSGSHVTIELTDKSHAYTSTNSDQTPYERTLQVRFNNRGNEKAKATFTMILPEGVTYRSVSNGTGSYDTQTRILTVTKEGIPGQGTHVTDINLTFDTSAPRTFEVETQNVTYATSPDYLPKNSNNGLGRSIQLGNVGSYSVTVAMYTSELQDLVNEHQATTQSYKYYNAPDDLKSKYDSVIEEGRQILENLQSTQQAINDIANRIGTAKDALNGELTNKDALQVAVDEADNTTNGPFYSRLQDIDSNLKSEYDQAIAEAQQILGNQHATQKEAKQATDKLNLQEMKVALKKYEESIKTYQESYDQLPKLDNDQIFVTGKANRQLAKLWSEIDKSRISAWNKVYQNNIKQNLQADFFKIRMKHQKLSAVPNKTEISIPTEKISVHDLGANLSLEEKNIIKKAIEDSNNFLSGTKVGISDDGTATITFPDHTKSESSQETIDRSELIRELTPGEKQLLLEKQKEEAISDIESLIDLSDDERQTLKDKVVEAGTADKIVEILAEASGLSFEKLEEAKATLEAKVDALVESANQKAAFKEAIKDASTIEELSVVDDNVNSYLSALDHEGLEAAKATLTTKIGAVISEDAKKVEFLQEVDAAQTEEALAAIEARVDEEADEADEAELTDAKATLEAKVDALVESANQKAAFKEAIKDASTIEELSVVDDNVNSYLSALDHEGLEAAKATLTTKIGAVISEDAKKVEFLQEVDAAQTEEALAAIEARVDEEADEADEAELTDAKATLEAKVDALVESANQKAAFKEAIKDASTIEELSVVDDNVNSYLSALDHEGLEAAKATLTTKIGAVISEDAKKVEFLQEVDAAQTEEALAAIEARVDEEADEADEAELTDTKATLEAKVDALVESANQKAAFKEAIKDASTIEELSVVDDNVNSYLSALDHEGLEAAKATLTTKIGAVISEDAKKVEFLQEVDAAQTEEALAAIEARVDEEADEADEAELTDAKATLEAKVDALVESANQKAAFKEAIKDASTIEELSVVDDNVNSYLSALDHEGLEAAKATLTTKIGAVISEDAKKVEFLQEVDAAQTEEALAAIEARVDEEADEADEAELTDAKATLEAKVDALVESANQKAAFKEAIKDASTIEELSVVDDNVNSYLSALDHEGLEAAKATLTTKIGAVISEDAKKVEFLQEVDAAQTEEALAAIEARVDEEADEADEAELTDAKATLEAKVDALVESANQKAAFKEAIKDASTIEELSVVDDNVNSYLSALDHEGLEAAKATLTTKIGAVISEDAKKVEFLQEVDAAQTEEALAAIEARVDEEADEADEAELTDAKATLEAKVDALVESANQKAAFKEAIKDASTIEELSVVDDNVNSYLSALDHEGLEAAKATLTTKIGAVISEDAKKVEFLQEVDAAQTEEALAAIEARVDEEADEADEAELTDAKATLEAKVDALVESANQKAAFKEAIKDASTIEELSVVDDNVNSYLSALDHEGLEAAKATLTTKIGAVISEDAKKVEFLQEVDAAQTEEALAAIEARVDEEADEADEAELTDAKATLEAKVDALVESANQKAAFKEAIKDASTIEELSVVDDNVNSYLSALDHEGLEAAKATLTTKIGAVISEDAKKVEFLQEVDAAQTEEALAAIEARVDEEADEADEAELTDAKATLEAKVDALVESANQKAAFKEAIKDASTIEELSVVDDNVNSYLSALDHEGLEAAKATLTTKIGAVISEDAKKVEFLQEVDAAQTEEALAAIEARVDEEADLTPSAPESGNGAGTVQPEKPESDGGTHGLGLINEKPAFPAEELGRLLQVERDKASAYVGTLSNLDASKVNEFKAAIQNAQTVPAIEAIIQAAEALNAKLAPSAPESGNGAGTVQPEKPEFNGGTQGLGLINEKPTFPAEELARLLQVERDKASAYVGTLSNLDASKVNEFKAAIQNAQTVPAIEAIIQAAEALNAKLAASAPEPGNGEGTVQPEMPEFDGGTHGLGLINEKPAFPAEELARLLQVERDKVADYIASLPNLDASKVNEFKAAIQQAQTVLAIEAISQTAEALNAKLAASAPESGNGEGTVQPEMPEFDGGTHGLGLINEKPAFPAEELEQGKVSDEQEQSTEPKAPTQPGQNAPESEHPVDKPAVTDHLQKVKTQVNGQQSIQESTKQEKSGERLPDTATISWLLGVTGISTLLAGLGLKKKREDDDK